MNRQINIHNRLSIPEHELRFKFSKSSGPGGQHVNKAATKVELLFDVQNSPSLTESQRNRIAKKLEKRISAEGILRIEVQDTRSQVKNRQKAIERFQKLISEALRKPKRRIPTKPGEAAKEKRISEKKQRSEIKKYRKPPPD